MSTTTSHGTATEKKQTDERRRTRKTGTTPKPTPTTGTRQPPQQPPDGASRKGSDVGTPPPPEQGIGFSPRAGGDGIGVGDLNEASEEGTGTQGVGDVVATAGQGFPPVPSTLTSHPATPHGSGRRAREEPVRDEISPDLTLEPAESPQSHHRTLAASQPPTRPETLVSLQPRSAS
jgi:hypothetical protein